MTRTRAKELLPIIQAFAEGKSIQFNSYKDGTGRWNDFDSISPIWDDNTPIWDDNTPYRIKPEPKLRPWMPEEVPVGATVSSDKEHKDRFLITALWHGKLFLNGSCECDNADKSPNINVLVGPYWNYTLDNGLTWKPCGVLCD